MANTFNEDLLLNNFERLLRHENPSNTNFSKFYDMRNYIQSFVNISQFNVISLQLDELIKEYSIQTPTAVAPGLKTSGASNPIEQMTTVELLKQIKKELLTSHDTEIIDKYIYKFFTTLITDNKDNYNGITQNDIYILSDKLKNLCSNLVLKEIDIKSLKEKPNIEDVTKLNDILELCKKLNKEDNKISSILNQIESFDNAIKSEEVAAITASPPVAPQVAAGAAASTSVTAGAASTSVTAGAASTSVTAGAAPQVSGAASGAAAPADPVAASGAAPQVASGPPVAPVAAAAAASGPPVATAPASAPVAGAAPQVASGPPVAAAPATAPAAASGAAPATDAAAAAPQVAPVAGAAGAAPTAVPVAGVAAAAAAPVSSSVAPDAASGPPGVAGAPQSKTDKILTLKNELYYQYELYKINKNTPLNLTILQIDTDRYIWQKTINIFKPLFDIFRSQSENVMYGGRNIILLTTIKDKIKEQINNIKPKSSLD